MKTPEPNSAGSAVLNATRGLAAVLVAFQHARLVFLQPAWAQPDLSAVQKVFYLLGSFGPSSVMVFFVLSGFLVGAPTLRAEQKGVWNYRSYIVARAARLYTALVPALIIGLAIDWAGLAYLGWTTPYSTPGYAVMLPADMHAHMTLPVFIGHLVFLQGVFVPTLGTNHPLWSLTNEAWYYLLFPLALLAALRPSIVTKLICAALFVAALIILPIGISSLFLVWLMGAGLALVPAWRAPVWVAVFSTLPLLAFLVAQSAGLIETPLNNFTIGILFTATLWCWLGALEGRAAPKWFDRPIAFIADISFSLYVFHTPFLVLLAALVIRDGEQLAAGPYGFAVVIAGLLAAISYSTVMWFFFERNTKKVRSWLAKRIATQAVPARAVSS
jgi:peptidoglycan/LPS O-acetylase OafA/YrhL